MIKTEQVADNDQEYDDPSSIKDRDVVLIIVITLIVIGFLGYTFFIKNNNHIKALPSDHYNNLKALPLSTSPSNSLNGLTSSSTNTNQSNASSSSLGSGTINLQNNTPSQSNSSNPSNSLQSVNGSQSTGQAINPNEPY